MTTTYFPEANYVVSYWYVPGGCNYMNAEIIEEFFETEGAAIHAAMQIGEQPPEMAQVIEITDNMRTLFSTQEEPS